MTSVPQEGHKRRRTQGAAFSPEEETLLCCARTRLAAPEAERLYALLQANIDWERLWRLAQRHSLHLLLYQHLEAIGVPAAQESLVGQQRRFHATAMRSEILTKELLSLLALFDAHGIEAIPYKGPALAALFGDPALRPCSDLDLLVRPTDVLRAKEILLTQGYQPQHRFSSAAQEAAHLQTDCEYNLLRTRDGLPVELHWRFRPGFFPFPLDMDALWRRRQTVLLAGVPVPSFSPEDLLLILCVHGAKHRWERLMWVCDVAELMRARPDIAWARVTEQAAGLHCTRVLLLGLFLARDLLDAPVPGVVLDNAPPVIASLAAHVSGRIGSERDGLFSMFARSLFHWSVRERLRDRVPYVQDRLRREAGQMRGRGRWTKRT